MSEAQIGSYLLTASAVNQLVQSSIHGLEPELLTLDEVEPYTALDDFDQALRLAGQLLIKTKDTLELIDNDGQALTQAFKGTVAFPGDIPDGALDQGLKSLSSLRRLMPIGTGLRQHAELSLHDKDRAVHCRIALVFLTGDQGGAAAVATFPATTDYPESLNLVRERMLELHATEFDGRELVNTLLPIRQLYDAKPDVAVPTDSSAYDAVNDVISALIPVARANEPGIIADHDTEFLHDYRIQLRKIRSILSMFKKVHDKPQATQLKSDFAAIMAATGALRDLDVYLLDKPKYYDLLPVSLHAGLDTLFEMFAQHRQAEQIKLAELLSGKQYKEQISQIAAVFSTPGATCPGPAADLPVPAYARELIWKRYRKACKLAEDISTDSPDEQFHALRIQCKKLRYLMECFSRLFPPAELKAQLGVLKKLQDSLGLFNDYSIQQQSLIKAIPRLPRKNGAPDIESAACIGALIAVLHGRQQQERAKSLRGIARFNRAKTQKAIRKLLQQGDGS